MGERLTIIGSGMGAILSANGFQKYTDFTRDDLPGMVSRSGTTCTRRIHLVPPDSTSRAGIECYLKQYRYEGRRWRHRFRTDKASIERRNYDILGGAGLNAPQVIAHGSRRRGLRLLDAFLLTRGLPDAMPMDAWFGASDSDERERILSATAATVASMHNADFYHIDLQWRNVLITGRKGDVPVIYLFDSPRGGLRRGRARGYHGRLRDLSSLYKEARLRLTRTDQLRWLRAYLAAARVNIEPRSLIWTILRDRGSKDRLVVN